MTRTRTLRHRLFPAAALLLLPALARAQSAPDATLEAHGGVGFPTGQLGNLFDLGPEAGVGLSFWFGPRVAFRLGGDLQLLQGANGAILTPGGRTAGPDARLWGYTAGLAVRLTDPERTAWEVVVNAGGGASTLSTGRFADPASPGSTRGFTHTYPAANAGLKVGYAVSRTVALFVQGQSYLTFFKKADTQVLRNASGGRASTFGQELTIPVSAGIEIRLGGTADRDHDGVDDDRDQCPGTPRGVQVDTTGCAVDTDRDGVPDYRDQCSGTPRGATVDARGCPVDGDADDVPDGIDQCPSTPAGARVDDRGCPSDTDGDGVVDGVDQCPSTPAGASVDSSGCPVDGDQDGVPDGIDQCPNTAPGTEVDETGCPRSQVQEELEEKGRVILHNVYFDFNKSTLRPDSKPALDEVGNALVKHPRLRIEIQGHTDAVGPAAYNQRLSQRRAQAVLDYLMANFPSLDRGAFVVRGYGESQPIATNATAEGRQENRRVEFVVLEGSGDVQGEKSGGS